MFLHTDTDTCSIGSSVVCHSGYFSAFMAGQIFHGGFLLVGDIQALHVLNRMECHRVLLPFKRPFGLDQSPLAHSTHNHQIRACLFFIVPVGERSTFEAISLGAFSVSAIPSFGRLTHCWCRFRIKSDSGTSQEVKHVKKERVRKRPKQSWNDPMTSETSSGLQGYQRFPNKPDIIR